MMKKIISLSLVGLGAIGILIGVTTSAAQAACVKNVARGDKLNVRTGPGVSYRKKGAIPRQVCGVKVLWHRRVGKWLPVRYAGMKGWVNRAYIGRRGGIRRCKRSYKVFKSGGYGSAHASVWRKRQIRKQARVRWQQDIRYKYGLNYNDWRNARRKILRCSITHDSGAYVCKAEAKPCNR